jgi:hypothetical protein
MGMEAKNHFERKRFWHDHKVKAEMRRWEQTLSPDFFSAGMKQVAYP